MSARKAFVIPPGQGRKYEMGKMTSVFKADCRETGNAYSVSEWWLEPLSKGPPDHSNPEDHVWYVIEGTMSILLGGKWIDAPRGSCVVIPGGVKHNFENRTAQIAAILNINVPGGFEEQLPGMVEWFKQHPSG